MAARVRDDARRRRMLVLGIAVVGFFVALKRYREWEANRKVFLYPENWLEPDLRDDRSGLFSELCRELG